MDHRLFRRRAMAINFRVLDDASGAFLGRIGDISYDGMMIYGGEPLEVERIYLLRVEFEDSHTSPCSAHFRARAMWTGEDRETPTLFATGFSLLDLDIPVTSAALEYLIQRFSVRAADHG
jgi:hypothetical protein